MENRCKPLEADPVRIRELVEKLSSVVDGLPMADALNAITASLIVALMALAGLRNGGLSPDSMPEARVLDIIRNVGSLYRFNFEQYINLPDVDETSVGLKEQG